MTQGRRNHSCELTKERVCVMKSFIRGLSVGLIGLALATVAMATTNRVVGGSEMFPQRDIIQNAVNSADHTTLVAAVKAAGLVQTLESPGPFTVFAPTNSAFDKLPAGTVQTLLKPENKAELVKVLTYHVVPGRLTTFDLKKRIEAGGGHATLKTANGETLTAREEHGEIVLVDDKGDSSRITIANVMQSNGVIQVVDTVVLPN